jgi:rod shape-determining protein MreC
MAYQTLERSPPPFFRQGPSALTRLAFYAALSVLLMAMDARWHLVTPLRQIIATAIEPVVQLARAPVLVLGAVAGHFESLQAAQSDAEAQRKTNVQLALKAELASQLQSENASLRALLKLQRSVPMQTTAAEIVAQASDPFSRKLFIDRGSLAGIALGSPVMDETGLLGQVTQLDPLGAQVTLVTDRDSTVPVEVARDGERGVLAGDADATSGGLELRWQAADTTVRVGDILVTSGLDGIYPAGLAVARVTEVQRRPDATFARVLCAPLAHVNGGRHVLVLKPLAPLALGPAAEAAKAGKRSAARP